MVSVLPPLKARLPVLTMPGDTPGLSVPPLRTVAGAVGSELRAAAVVRGDGRAAGGAGVGERQQAAGAAGDHGGARRARVRERDRAGRVVEDRVPGAGRVVELDEAGPVERGRVGR